MWWAIYYTHSVSSMKQLPEMPMRGLPSMNYSSSPPRGKCPSGRSTQKILTKQLTCCPKNIFISKNMNYLQHIFYFPFCQAALLQKIRFKSWTQSNTRRPNTLICPKQGFLLLLISKHTGTFSCFIALNIQSFKKLKKARQRTSMVLSPLQLLMPL